MKFKVLEQKPGNIENYRPQVEKDGNVKTDKDKAGEVDGNKEQPKAKLSAAEKEWGKDMPQPEKNVEANKEFYANLAKTNPASNKTVDRGDK